MMEYKVNVVKVVVANEALPAVTAQDVGRVLYHGRQKLVQIVGSEETLQKIGWIFQRVPDMFGFKEQPGSLVVWSVIPDIVHRPAAENAGQVFSSNEQLLEGWRRWFTEYVSPLFSKEVERIKKVLPPL